MRVLVVTISDRCSKGEATDVSGPRIVEIIAAFAAGTGRTSHIQTSLVPDDVDRIQRVVANATDRSDPLYPTLIVTTGGTGFAKRDVTPEAIRPMLDKEAPQVTQYMLHLGLQHTPMAWLSRAVAGIRKRTIIITLPGNPKAINEVLPSLLENGLLHAMQLTSGEGEEREHSPGATVPRSLSNSPVRHVTPSPPQDERQPSITLPRLSSEAPPSAPVPPTVFATFGPNRIPTAGSTTLVPNQLTPRRGHSEAGVPPYRPKPAAEAKKITGAAARARESSWPMVPMETAIEVILSAVESCGMLRTCTLPLHRALGHVLAEPVYSEFNHPPFRASIKDGYAVIAADGPGLYPVVGALVAGSAESVELHPRQICRVNTGGPIPDGADAVVQVEDTKVMDVSGEGEEATVLIMSRAKKGQDIRPIGCDLPQGGSALQSGCTISASEIGLAASVGATNLTVFRKPRVAILSTGDELEEPFHKRKVLGSGNIPSYGKIFDSNKSMLMAAVVESGLEVCDAGIARDNMDDTRDKLERALSEADIVITSGGVSMGEVDCVKLVLAELGATTHFGRVNMKPGKPTTFASIGSKLVFALPGNPVSAMVCYHLFVVPALLAASGANPSPVILKARLEQDFKLDEQRPEYHRCRITRQLDPHTGNELFVASSTGVQASHRLLSMAGANGLVVLPSGSGVLTTGTLVDVVLIGHVV